MFYEAIVYSERRHFVHMKDFKGITCFSCPWTLSNSFLSSPENHRSSLSGENTHKDTLSSICMNLHETMNLYTSVWFRNSTLPWEKHAGPEPPAAALKGLPLMEKKSAFTKIHNVKFCQGHHVVRHCHNYCNINISLSGGHMSRQASSIMEQLIVLE